MVDSDADMAKIFGIGNNKTGTTSLLQFIKTLGFAVGAQKRSEDIAFKHLYSLMSHEFWQDLAPEIESAQFFQDIPFSNPVILRELVRRYPDAYFIYTKRRPESWYQSLVTSHARAAGFQISIDSHGELRFDPADVIDKLESWNYRGFKGLDLVSQHFGFDVSEAPYERDRFIAFHRRHQDNAIKTLANSRAVFVDIIEEPQAAAREVVVFLGHSTGSTRGLPCMPHLNAAPS